MGTGGMSDFYLNGKYILNNNLHRKFCIENNRNKSCTYMRPRKFLILCIIKYIVSTIQNNFKKLVIFKKKNLYATKNIAKIKYTK